MPLSDFKAKKAEAQSLLSSHMSTISRNKTKLGEIEVEKTQNIKAIGVMDKAIQIVSANGIGKIESVVSDGLKLIFDSDYKLIIERKDGVRGESYKILLEKNGFTAPPIESVGGGLVNVISFLLRVIMIQRFKLAKLIVLDESLNNISSDHIESVSKMLKTLCDDYGYTILAVTHQSLLAASADKVYKVETGPTLVECDPSEFTN
jgi:DNA repair exonuclease SbcCD ATPase subunit